MNIEQTKNTLREFQTENRRKFKNTQAELKKAVSYIKKKCTSLLVQTLVKARCAQTRDALGRFGIHSTLEKWFPLKLSPRFTPTVDKHMITIYFPISSGSICLRSCLSHSLRSLLSFLLSFFLSFFLPSSLKADYHFCQYLDIKKKDLKGSVIVGFQSLLDPLRLCVTACLFGLRRLSDEHILQKRPKRLPQITNYIYFLQIRPRQIAAQITKCIFVLVEWWTCRRCSYVWRTWLFRLLHRATWSLRRRSCAGRIGFRSRQKRRLRGKRRMSRWTRFERPWKRNWDCLQIKGAQRRQ